MTRLILYWSVHGHTKLLLNRRKSMPRDIGMFEVSHYPTAEAQYILYLYLCHNTFIHNKLGSVSKAAYILDTCIPESSDKVTTIVPENQVQFLR